MIFSILAAMDLNRGIGWQGKIPWHLPSDLKRFRHLTMGHHLIMGRKTFNAIGRPLPGRVSIVISRHPEVLPPGCYAVDSLDKAMEFVRLSKDPEAFIIGGGEIFAQALEKVQRMYLTVVHAEFPCDVWFPAIDERTWTEVYREEVPKSDCDPYPSTYRILEKMEEISKKFQKAP